MRRSRAPATVRLGAHMSVQGGMHLAVERAARVRATALQVFVKSSRQWAARPLSASEIRTFRDELARRDLTRHTLAHATYLINLAARNSHTRRQSIRALALEVERCEQLGIPYLVLHPGSHLGAGEEAGLERVVDALDRVLAPRPRGRTRRDPVTVLLETTAGQGTNLGHRFEHLGFVLERSRAGERLGVCFDTCHALAAGYEFCEPCSYETMWRDFDRAVGLERLRAFHLNDSKHGLGSRKDRHEHIGRGEVGREAFRLILNDRRFRDLPMVLETPKGPDLAEDRRNLAALRRLLR